MNDPLSKKQGNVLLIMMQGFLHYDFIEAKYSLSDAEHNDYFIRKDTVAALIDGGYIQRDTPGRSQHIFSYSLTKAGEKYLGEFHKEEVMAFIGQETMNELTV